MPVNINDVKQFVEDLAKKDQKTDYLKAATFNRYAKAAQLDIINDQRNSFEMGSISSDNLSELKVTTQVNLDYSTGQLTKPSDYLYYVDTLFTKFSVNKRGDEFASRDSVDIVTSGQLGERLNSQFRNVSKSSPIVVEYDTVLQYFPVDLGVVDLVYLKNPPDPTWAYTLSSNIQIYDSGNSVDFELPIQLRNDLVYKICEYLGISVSQQDLTQGSAFLKSNQ